MTQYLIVTGILFLIVGLRALIKPIDAVAIPYSLDGEGTDAKNYLRSGAGGVTVASGAVMVAGGWLVPALALPGLVMAVTILGGLLFGRLVSLVVDGSPGVTPWVSAIFELIGFGFGALWLWQSFA